MPTGTTRSAGWPPATTGCSSRRLSAAGWSSEYYNNTTNSSTATPVAVTLGQVTSGINASLEQGGSISGHVTDSSGAGLANVSVSAQTATCCGTGGFASTDANGNYTISGLPAGNYQVQFTAPSGSGLVSEYYNNTTNSSTATPVAVTVGQVDERDRCDTRPGRIDHRSRHQQQRSSGWPA